MKFHSELEIRLHGEYYMRRLAQLKKVSEQFSPPIRDHHVERSDDGNYIKVENQYGSYYSYRSTSSIERGGIKERFSLISSHEDMLHDYVAEEAEKFITKLREARS